MPSAWRVGMICNPTHYRIQESRTFSGSVPGADPRACQRRNRV